MNIHLATTLFPRLLSSGLFLSAITVAPVAGADVVLRAEGPHATVRLRAPPDDRARRTLSHGALDRADATHRLPDDDAGRLVPVSLVSCFVAS
jgi:hypothetical protein